MEGIFGLEEEQEQQEDLKEGEKRGR